MAFEHRIPQFTPDRVLTRQILGSMRDLAYWEQIIRHDDLSDGIVAGCELFEDSMHVGVTSGIVKYAGRLYMLHEKESVAYHPTDQWTLLKIEFGPQRPSQDFVLYSGSLILDTGSALQANEMELGRFKLQHGSVLRTRHMDFRDLDTEYDTVNLIHVRYASKGGATISPLITEYYAREAFPFLRDNALDIAFCTACLAGAEPVRREMIQRYICGRLEIEYREMSNTEIHRSLALILDSISKGTSIEGKKRSSSRRIIMD